jgi:hypothetical protein
MAETPGRDAKQHSRGSHDAGEIAAPTHPCSSSKDRKHFSWKRHDDSNITFNIRVQRPIGALCQHTSRSIIEITLCWDPEGRTRSSSGSAVTFLAIYIYIYICPSKIIRTLQRIWKAKNWEWGIEWHPKTLPQLLPRLPYILARVRSTFHHIVTCMSDYRRGFGLQIGFIDHFNIRHSITLTYTRNLHTLEIATVHAKYMQSVSAPVEPW